MIRVLSAIPVVLIFALLGSDVVAQSVAVGQGSYSTTLPNGAVGPRTASGQPVFPKTSSSFSKPVQSNDFWSSLIFPFFGVPHSNVMYAHPLGVKAVSTGLEIGHTADHVFAANDFLYPFAKQMTVGVSGLSASRTLAHDYGDWTATALWEDGALRMEATFGHGLPFVFFRLEGGDAVISTSQTPSVWHNEDGVLGITISGRHYGVFAPTGSSWSGTTRLTSSLDGKDYLSVALLPDNRAETLELFRTRAYAFVTGSTVSWQYDENASDVQTTYAYETTLMEDGPDLLDETLTALYRHQWLYTSDALTGHTYASPRGTMKLLAGRSFTTDVVFGGVLPSLPDQGDYNPGELLALVQEAAQESLPLGGTYDNGKAMGRFSHLVHIADQLGADEERDHFLAEIKTRLEDWFTVGGAQEYSYNDQWDVLTGYPSGYGADREINDHHFHASYAVSSAATVAQYDSAWASLDAWGGMVNLLIRDANNWDRTDTQFPFLRSFDAYAGHSWAAGHGDFGDGNNQESSSESMHFATAAILWGEATSQPDIRDLGVYLHATERTAVEQYWFDVDDVVFPSDYPHVAIGMVWGGKGVHSTWFGADPEFIHGINILPMTGGSLYLGRHPDYVIKNYDEIVEERSGEPNVWKDVLWEYLSLGDAARALSLYLADPNYAPFDGESRAHTLHWLYNLKKMGHVDTTVTANTPSYAVFRDAAGEKTYSAFNAGDTDRLISFSDGYEMRVGPRSLASATTRIENPDAPVAILQTDRTTGKTPLRISFLGSGSFDRNGSSLDFSWDFGGFGNSLLADTTFTFQETGEHLVRLSVTNGAGLVARDSVLITVLGNGTPFFGSPSRVPGRIQAENYDLGGEGVAYHDAEAQNIGLAYRPDEGVDLESASTDGFDVYWITDGEWLEYTIEVTQSGVYTVSPYVATVPGFGTLTLKIDGEDVSGVRGVRSTGGWQFWRPIEISDVVLSEGEHIMRLEFASPTDRTGWLMSVNYIEVELTTPTDRENDLSPSLFELSQNYPNPFNPSTEIAFSVPSAGLVRVEVFDALGRLVRTLVDASISGGEHVVQFDASQLSTGIYLYRMTSAGATTSRTMYLIK